MVKKIKIAFVWHFHQPTYQTDNNSIFLMPWVRFHATKDYLSMLNYVDEIKGLKLNFNITPVLIDSLERYANGVEDICSKFLLCDIKNLTDKDKFYILDNFFDSNYTNMILPKKHYSKLYKKKCENQEIKLSDYTEQDYADIIANFNLCWINKDFQKDYPELEKLFKKEKNYTKNDRKKIHDISQDIIKKIIPEFKKHLKERKIEISTSPYYHPILPLLLNLNEEHYQYSLNLPINMKVMKKDADLQVKKAIEKFEQTFDEKPKGLWLSEQCISKNTVKLLDNNNIKWTISDIGILENSLNKEFLRDFNGNLLDPFYISSVYKLNNIENTNIIFSDSFITSLIGFTYGNYDPSKAAQHLYEQIKNVQNKLQNSPNENHLITIAMDGENCWETYPDNGKQFLKELYSLITKDLTLKTVLLSDYMEKNTEITTLDNLASGSWINRNFDLWIGEPVKNLAWSYIGTTIEDIFSIKNTIKDKKLFEQARNEILIAQGSDWFWWYGEPNDSGRDYLFDFLFRERLKNVYKILSKPTPDYLNVPLISMIGKPIRLPRKKITPKIDGAKDILSDNWKDAGCIFLPDSPTFSSKKIVKGVCYCFDDTNLYLKIETNKMNTKQYKDVMCQIFVYMINNNEKTVAPIRLVSKTENIYPILKNKFTHEIKISIFNEKLLTTLFAQAIPNNLWVRYYPKNIQQAYQETIEISVPLEALMLKSGDTTSFCVVEAHNGTIEGIYPQDIMINLSL